MDTRRATLLDEVARCQARDELADRLVRLARLVRKSQASEAAYDEAYRALHHLAVAWQDTLSLARV